MKTIASPSIPLSPDTAVRFASLTEEQKRVIRLRVAIEIGRLSKPKSRVESAAEFRAASAAIGNRARRKGLTLAKLKRMTNSVGCATGSRRRTALLQGPMPEDARGQGVCTILHAYSDMHGSRSGERAFRNPEAAERLRTLRPNTRQQA